MNKKEIADMEYDYMVTYRLNTAAVRRFQQNEVRTRKLLLRVFSDAMSDRFDVWLPRLKFGAKPGLRTGTTDRPYLPLKLVARYVATSDRLFREKLVDDTPRGHQEKKKMFL